MKARLNYAKAAPAIYDAMDALDQYIGKCGLERPLVYLVQLRASQINGCAYCLDMHWKDLRALNETEQRLYSLDAWRESPYYTDRERAPIRHCETNPDPRHSTSRCKPPAAAEAGPKKQKPPNERSSKRFCHWE